MTSNFSLLTYGMAAIIFALLTVLLLVRWQVRPLGPALLAACGTTSVWATIIATGTLAEYPPISLIQLAELARDAAWLFFLLQLLSLQSDGDVWLWRGQRWARTFVIVTAILFGVVGARVFLPSTGSINTVLHSDLMLGVWLLLTIGGLVLVEQLYRNATTSERWSIKFLCFALGAVYAYDFFMYAEALLFRQLNPLLWQSRGLVTALVMPWIAVASTRSSEWRMDLHISRHVVFHTVTLMGAGLYLLGMAVIGYFIKYLGGSWGGVLQVGFFAASVALLLSLLFSGRVRAELRVFLSKHFFSYRYDYRDEWLKFTQSLAQLNENVEEGIVGTLASLAQSPGGLLWDCSETKSPQLCANWHMNQPDGYQAGLGNLPQWLARSGWVIDLRERKRAPDLYEGLRIPPWLEQQTDIWLIIPLVFRDQVIGVVMLQDTDLKRDLNWEDRDLLKTAGRQAASHLAQHLANEALLEARQFDAFNRLSAYVVHDLKNILAQQALIVSNAARHRDNPAFIDDMIDTVENSVVRMRRLMEQMRSGERSRRAGKVEISALLKEICEGRSSMQPEPATVLGKYEVFVDADPERLATVFSHLIQNAQEATDSTGTVTVTHSAKDNWSTIVIADTGRGMDEAFLRERLFRPFDSTKGLTGMGIGAFESREYIRQIGGDIQVESCPGKGTTFRITIPESETVDQESARAAAPA